MNLIDLRSDTVTRPCPGMRKAIAEAEVGEDVFGEDPTVNRLQERVAEMFGKEAALFVPSGTMGNEICLNVHTEPGQEVICESDCHILNLESGAAAFLAGIQLRALPGVRGVLTVEQVEKVIHPPVYYFPQTAVVAIENTHGVASGAIYPIAALQELFEMTRARNLRFHIDGARIWNAAKATGIPLSRYGCFCDSISVCFSKGLGAPIGSAIAGTTEFIRKAHRLRKIFGGGMRQVGILAAAVLYALDHNLDRLEEDHANARLLAEELTKIKNIEVDLEAVQTNIVMFDITKTQKSVESVINALKAQGVLVVPFGGARIRAVTHLDVNRENIYTAVKIFSNVLKGETDFCESS